MASKSHDGNSFPSTTIAVLVAVLVFGLDSTFGQLSRNGLLRDLNTVMRGENYRFPDSDDALLRRYTGIPFVDNFLVYANFFLAHLGVTRHPEIALCVFNSAGQFLATYIVLVIEGLRIRNSRNAFFFSALWGILIQVFAYANVMPLYCILHLLITSRSDSKASEVRLRDPLKLVALIPALIPGYFLVACLSGTPFQDSATRQWLHGILFLFPIQVAFWQFLTTKVFRKLSIWTYQKPYGVEMDGMALEHVYDFAWNIAALCQFVSYAVLAVAKYFPGSFISSSIARKLTFVNAFIPGPSHTDEPWTTATSAMHDVFIYNCLIGSIAVLVWAYALLRRTCPSTFSKEGLPATIVALASEFLFAGPAGILIWLLRHRDGDLLESEREEYDSQERTARVERMWKS